MANSKCESRLEPAVLKYAVSIEGLPSWRANIAEINKRGDQLTQLNSALEPNHQFSEQHIVEILNRIIRWNSDPYVQLNEIFAELDEADFFVEPKPGKLGIWEQPIHDWLRGLLDLPLLNAEESKALLENHRTQKDLNPIQELRYQQLIQRANQVAEKIGQAVFTTEDLKYAAFNQGNTAYRRALLELYEQMAAPPRRSILETDRLIQELNRDLHQSVRVGGEHLLTARLISRADDSIFKELEFYRSLSREERHRRQEMIGARLRSLHTLAVGTYQSSIEFFIKQELRQALEFYAADRRGVGYIGPLLFYHLKKSSLERTEVESLDWNQARIKAVGEWSDFHNNPSVVVEVEVPGAKTRHRFAVVLRPRFSGARVPFQNLTYDNLVGLEIVDLKKVDRSVRMADAFKSPLENPLFHIVSEDVESKFIYMKSAIAKMVVTRVKMPAKDGPLTTEEALEYVGDAVASVFLNRPDGEYASIQWFDQDNNALSAQVLNLPLVEERTGQELYSGFFSIGFGQRIFVQLRRNLVSGNFGLKIERQIGFGSYWKTVLTLDRQFVN